MEAETGVPNVVKGFAMVEQSDTVLDASLSQLVMHSVAYRSLEGSRQESSWEDQMRIHESYSIWADELTNAINCPYSKTCEIKQRIFHIATRDHQSVETTAFIPKSDFHGRRKGEGQLSFLWVQVVAYSICYWKDSIPCPFYRGSSKSPILAH